MKRLTREERRRIQRRAANIRFLAFVLILLALGVCIGYTAAHAQNACEPPKPQEVSQPSPVDDTPQEPAEQPAEDYSSLDRLELIGTFTATAYCPCVKCCGIWSEDHPSRGEDYVQKTRAGTIPEEGRTIAADWDVLPKGSEVVINGHPYIVEDTGSAVKGNHVDIFFESHEAACEFGIQQVEVYLGAEDIDDGTEPVLTIAGLWYGSVTLQRGKENKDVLSFKEERVPGILQVRPLIVNSTNRKTLRKLFGDAKASTLVGKQIQLYVDHNVRDPQDGGMTDGIRIRPYKPRVQKQEPVPPCTDCGNPIEAAMGKNAHWLAAYTTKNYGVPLCAACAQKRKEAAAAAEMQQEAENAAEVQQDSSPENFTVDPDTGEVL